MARRSLAGAGGGRDQVDPVPSGPLNELSRPPEFEKAIVEIIELWRQRQALARVEHGLKMRTYAICSRLVNGDKDEATRLYRAVRGLAEHPQAIVAAAAASPFISATPAIHHPLTAIEKRLKAIVHRLPIWQKWAISVFGVAEMTVAGIIGEAGDLARYRSDAALWRRMCLDVASDGRAARKARGDASSTFVPARHRFVVSIATSIIMTQASAPQGQRRYRDIYERRLASERERHPELRPIHLDARARRYAIKMMLRDMWRNWRRTGFEMLDLPASSPAGLGGRATSGKMSPEERSEAARRASLARWGKKLP